jgi:cytosine permease
MKHAEKLQQLNQLSGEQIYDIRIMDKRQGDQETAQDDYASRRVPGTWRWSAWGSLWAFTGMSTAMAYPLTIALISVAFGAPSTLIALALTLIYAWLGVYYLSKKASKEGAILELISRHTFGFKGSAYQILLFGFIGTIYFSLEGHVMSTALSEAVPILPYQVSAAIVCIAFIPLTVYGMVFLEKLQAFTVWLYVLGIIMAIVGLFGGWAEQASSALAGSNWWSVNPNNVPLSWVSILGSFSAFAGLLGSILVLLCTDTARFAKRNEAKKAALLTSLVGVTVPLLLTPLFGVYLLAATAGKNPDPGVSLVWLMGPIGLLLVLITQVRVNVINVYFGTNALENFTSQILKLHWKRSKFLVPFMLVCYIILVSPFLNYFATIMTMLSVFLINWTAVLFGDFLLVRKKYDIPEWSEFRRGYVAEYNKIGMYSMWLPTLVGVLMGSGMFGLEVQALSVPVAGVAAFFMPVIVANLMSKELVLKQYFARIPLANTNLGVSTEHEHKCIECNHSFHKSDFVLCPFKNNTYICSNCCASEKHCGLVCHSDIQINTATAETSIPS